MGKTIDMGALILQNEQVRAVGNMGVNARGDLVDATNSVIDQRNSQIQRQYNRQTNVSDTPVATSSLSARQSRAAVTESEPIIDFSAMNAPDPAPKVDPEATGLAGAMARSRATKK